VRGRRCEEPICSVFEPICSVFVDDLDSVVEMSRDLGTVRALGFKLVGEGRLLADFVSFADQAGVHTLTTELALAWATSP
jgi:hypothetical protein